MAPPKKQTPAERIDAAAAEAEAVRVHRRAPRNGAPITPEEAAMVGIDVGHDNGPPVRKATNGHASSSAELRVPPHSVEAEAAVLGGLVLGRDAWPIAQEARLAPTHFFRFEHRLVYEAVVALASTGRMVDRVAVYEQLVLMGRAQEVAGMPGIDRIVQYEPPPAVLAQHMQTVLAYARQRERIRLADQIATAAFSGDDHLTHTAIERLLQIQSEATPDHDGGAAALQALRGHTVQLSGLAGREVPPPRFMVDQWLPEGAVTLLAAHGEGGKSMLGLMVAICIAAGLPVLGSTARPPRKALFYSCEDALPVLEYRCQQYCAALSIDPASLDGWLQLIDASALDDPELFVEARDAVGRLTATYQGLQRLVSEDGVEFIVIDNASDTFAANEISRPAVRAFLRSVLRLLPRDADGTLRGAVLMLAHVNRSASNGALYGNNYSGSTAWHNSVRSRWELTRGKVDDDGDDNDQSDGVAPDAPPKPYILKRAKNNYAASDATGITFHWNHAHGVVLPDAQVSDVVQGIEKRNDAALVLTGMVEAHLTGQRIGTAVRANNNAFVILRDTGYALPPRLRKMAKLQPLLLELQQRGMLTVDQYTDSSRRSLSCWRPTDAGIAATKGAH